MAQVKRPDGSIRHVKNLGWLLRNWQLVKRLEWVDYPCESHAIPGEVLSAPRKVTPGMIDGVFRAHLQDGRTFATQYASFEVWCGFVNRPVFQGLPVTVTHYNITTAHTYEGTV